MNRYEKYGVYSPIYCGKSTHRYRCRPGKANSAILGLEENPSKVAANLLKSGSPGASNRSSKTVEIGLAVLVFDAKSGDEPIKRRS